MSPPTVVRCRSCQARMIWTQTEAGRSMPVDADADPTGSFVCWTNERGDAFSRKARAGEDDNRTRHTSHFATCPHADSHRKR